ncbi:MAG: hypothetical protein ABI605_16395 [Rhizobacter sp.]
MKSLRTTLVAAAVVTFAFSGCAQTPVDHTAHHPEAGTSGAGDAMPMVGSGGPMAQMDEHMKAMREMHEKMMRARTPEEKSALMAEHMKMMQDGMAMMDRMGPDGMMGEGGMKGMKGMTDKEPMRCDMGMHGHLMEKRMEMMHSMMQMMMDRMPQSPAKP